MWGRTETFVDLLETGIWFLILPDPVRSEVTHVQCTRVWQVSQWGRETNMTVIASTSKSRVGIDTFCAYTSPSHKLNIRLDIVV